MQWFRNLKIANKLFLSFGLMLAAMLFLGAFAVVRLQAVNASALEIRDSWLPSVRLTQALAGGAANARIQDYKRVMAATPAQRAAADLQQEKWAQSIAALRKEYERYITSDEERRVYEAYAAAFTSSLPVRDEMERLSDEGRTADATALLLGKSLEM